MTNTTIAKANKVVEMINARGIKATTQIKNVNGIDKVGVCVGEGVVRPIIYPNFNSDDINGMVDEVIKAYEQNINVNNDMFADIVDRFKDFEFAKQYIVPCLVAKVVDDIVSRDYLDLKVIYKYLIADKGASITIEAEHLKMWDITEEELFDIAKENVKSTFVNKSMVEMLSELIGMPAQCMMPNDPIRIFTTENKMYGASVLLFPEIFKDMGNDITILPSSVHEVIVLLDNDIENNELVNMITGINNTEVIPEEVLSNHPYIYSNGEIKGVE